MWSKRRPGFLLPLLVTCIAMACVHAMSASASPEGTIPQLQARYREHPQDVQVIHELAQALLVHVRVSADPQEMQQAGNLVEQALSLAPNDPRSWTLKAWSEMAQHRFGEALDSAHKAQVLGAHDAVTLGLMSDALVELGRYDEAVAVTQQLADRFPGLAVFTRAAYLRFLHGEMQGAIELTRRAADAGRPGSEEVVWTLMQLSELYRQDGQHALAEQAAQAASATLPGLAQPRAQLARVREAQGRFQEALALYKEAAQIQMNPDYALEIWRLALHLGDQSEARRQAALLKGMAQLDEKNGGLNRRVFAAFYAEQPDGLGEAERLARLELARRPDIYSHDLLAWILYRQGKIAEAKQHAVQGLRLDAPDFALRYHIGSILCAGGDKKRGGKLLQLALHRNPYLDLGQRGAEKRLKHSCRPAKISQKISHGPRA